MKISKKGGFSLVELAVVLAVMGVLVVVAVSGRSLLNSASISATIQEIRARDIAHPMFSNTYGCAAGDCKIATSAFIGSATNVRNGNGNSQIEWRAADAVTTLAAGDALIGQPASTWNSFTSLTGNEVLETNRHFFLAGIFSQDKAGCGYSTTIADTNANPVLAAGDKYTIQACSINASTANTSKLQDSYLTTVYVPSADVARNAIVLGKIYTGTTVTAYKNLNSAGFSKDIVANILRQIDIKSDDGLANSGDVRIVKTASDTESADFAGTAGVLSYATVGTDAGVLVKFI